MNREKTCTKKSENREFVKQRNGRIKVLYLVKWEGWDDPTWEPAEHLVNCKKKLDDFRREKLEVFRKNRQKTHQVVKEGEQKDGEEEDNEVADEEDEQKSQGIKYRN